MTPKFFSLSQPLKALLGPTIVMALMGGCAMTPKDPQTQVRQLATERWQALLAKKWDVAYQYTTPGFRKVRTLDEYRVRVSSVPVRWESAEVLRADCEAERCVVRIKLNTRPLLPPFNKTPIESGIDEIWVQQDGRWWIHERL